MPAPLSVHPSTPAQALTAFLHGIEPRAWVLALTQAGEEARATRALAGALDSFLIRATGKPLAQWPLLLWSCLLEQPALLATLPAGHALAGIEPAPRAALLLRIVAGLDFEPAAQVLGVTVPAYERSLRRALAQLDDARVQALREQMHEQVRNLPLERGEALAALRQAAMERAQAATLAAAAAPELPATGWRRPAGRWPLVALAALLALLALSFLWPDARRLLPGQSETLPAEPVSPRPELGESDIVTHPDYVQLSAPAEDALAAQIPFLSWIAAATIRPPLAPIEPAVAPAPAEFGALSATRQELLSAARDAWPALEPAVRTALLENAEDWFTRPRAQKDATAKRLGEWDSLPATERARRRAAFQAWLALNPGDREWLRLAAAKIAGLPAAEQQALRLQFSNSADDTQRMWWLGPALGQELAPIASLFAFLPEADRPALLVALRGLDASARADLAVLAPRLSEARRQALRRDLLAAPAPARAQLIRERLAQ